MMSNSAAVESSACCSPGEVIKDGDVHIVALLCHLFDDQNRLKIYVSLRAGEQCVHDICSNVGLPQNLVSHHLAVLRTAGVVKTRRDGHWVCYSVNKVFLALIYPYLVRLFDTCRVHG